MEEFWSRTRDVRIWRGLVVSIPSLVQVPVGWSFLSVTVGRNSLTKCRRSNNPWQHLPSDHLRLVPSFRGLGRLQAKGTVEFWSVNRCNSFGLCSSNADGSSSFSCSPWWTRLHGIEIVTSLRLQIGKGLCCMQWTGSGGNGKARQGGAN